ncbi:MAG: hypothetical protein KJN98_04645 [Pontiella sp.]|nr:hypothetical protein [Pontiella sp.]
MHRMVWAVLLACSLAVATHAGPAGDWKVLRKKNIACGFSDERVDQVLAECRKYGLSASETDALLSMVYIAHAEQLPAGCVYLKIEEGFAKGIPVEQIRPAAAKRLDCMRRADQLIMSVRNGRGGQHQHLVQHMCMAMESGLPEEVIEHVINRPGGFRYGRLIHVIEAGESLQLAGLPPSQIQQVMSDCLDRDLTGPEVMRVVEVIQTGLRDGMEFEAIHDALWVASD